MLAAAANQSAASRRVATAAAASRGRSMFVCKAFFGSAKTAEPSSAFYGFKVKDIDGKSYDLAKLKGKAVLVVNTASACGFTPQFAGLQDLFDKYAKQGLVVVGVPCNQFGSQDPGSNASIKQFVKSNYGVTFPLLAKADVNGANADPLFDWLKSEKGGFLTSDIKWNFSKFLIDREGNVVGRFGSTTTPAALEAEVKKVL